MKKIAVLFFLLISCIAAKAQERIRMDAMNFMLMQVRINPDDVSWRTFKAPVSKFQGVPFFVADANARFYSKEEVEAFTAELDKVLNPDKYFSKQEDYAVFYKEFLDKLHPPRDSR